MQTTPEKQKRRSRYVRDRADIPKIYIGQRDVDILKTIYEFRFLQTDQITKLIQGDPTSVKKRLAKLWRAYYLQRLFLPVWPGKPKPSPKAIYAIDKKGAEILTEVMGIDPELMRKQIKQNEIGERQLKHSLMVSNFATILTVAVREKKGVELLFFKHQQKALEDRVTVKGKRYPVIPDGFLGLEDKEGVFYFFLEADRSTMSNTRFLNKMRAYWNWYKVKGQQKKFGIKNFRVLTLTISPERAENLREITFKVKGDGRQEGSTLFWFADESKITLEDPQSVFNKIWRSSRADDEELYSILD